MKIRSLFFAALVGLASTFAFAQAPSLSPTDTTSLQQAIAAKDARAIAQLAKNNPSQAQAIARAAALGAPDQAAVFAAAVSLAAGDAAGVAKAVATAVPAQAATIAAAVARAIPNAATSVTTAVVEAAPAQAGAVAVAVITTLNGAQLVTMVRDVTAAAVRGVPAAMRSDTYLVTIAQSVANTGASFNVARMGASQGSGRLLADLARATPDATAATTASQAGRAAGTAGTAAGIAATTAASGLVFGANVVINTPSNNGNVDAGQVVSTAGT